MVEVECSGFAFLLELFRQTQLPKFYTLPPALLATEVGWSQPTSEVLFAIELIEDHTLHEVIVRNLHSWFTATALPLYVSRLKAEHALYSSQAASLTPVVAVQQSLSAGAP